MSMRDVPSRVRNHLYLYRGSMVLAGAGLVGFLLSYREVASPEAAKIDVATTIPALAYASIAAWLVGLALMFYSRRVLASAIATRTAELQAAELAKLNVETLITETVPDPADESGPADPQTDMPEQDA